MAKPTGPGQHAYENTTYYKNDILAIVEETGVIDPDTLEVIGGVALTNAMALIATKAQNYIIPLLGVAVDIVVFMNALTSHEQKALIRDMYVYVMDKGTDSGVVVTYQFTSIRKGSQGYFWRTTGAEITEKFPGTMAN